MAPREIAAFMALNACSSGVGVGRHVMPSKPKPGVGRGLESGILLVICDYVWTKEYAMGGNP